MHSNKKNRSLWILLAFTLAVAFPLAYQAQFQQFKQANSFVPALRQGLIDIPDAGQKELGIDLRQPRLIQQAKNVDYDAYAGIKPSIPFYDSKGVIQSEILEAPFLLDSVVMIWHGQNGISDNKHVKGFIRTSGDLHTWSDWVEVEGANSEFISPELFESQHITVPADHRYIQFKIELSDYNIASLPSIERIRLIYFEKDKKDEPVLNDNLAPPSIEQLSVEQQTAAAMQAVLDPQIISRTEWGCPDGQSAPLAPPEPNTPVTHLIVHHTLTGTRPSNPNDYKKWVYNVWQLHKSRLNQDGTQWGDIGYNLLIDPDGNVYEGRAGGLDNKGFHFSCHNSYTTGIALLGDFTTATPTTKALTTLKRVLAWRAQSWAINPTSISSPLYSPASSVPTLNIPTIAGHRDSNPITWSCTDTDARTCPGNKLYSLLPGIRTDVAGIPGFSIKSGAIGYFVTQGQQANVILTFKSYGSFQGTIALSVNGLPSGVTVDPGVPATAYLPANGTVTKTIILKSSLSTQTGFFPLTITATSGDLQRSTRLSVTVNSAPGNVIVNALYNGQPWSGAVSYDLFGPNGVIIGSSVPGTSSSLPVGTYRLVYRQGGPATFVNVTPSNERTLSAGQTLTFTLNFRSATPNPLNVTCLASPSTITVGQSSTFTASVSGGTSPYQYAWSGAVLGSTSSISKTFSTAGTFPSTVTITDNATPRQTKQASCSVQVNAVVPRTFDFYTFSSSRTIQAGQNTTFDLYLQPQNGFSGQVNFSLAGLPAGALVISGSQMNLSGNGATPYILAIQTGALTPSGIFPLTITANGLGVTRTINLTLTVTIPPPPPLSASCSISPNSIPLGQGATIYAYPSGGVVPYRYRINGVDMGNASSLFVIPAQAGSFNTNVTITDNQNRQASGSCSAQVILGNPYTTGFNYTPNPARAAQVINLNIYGGNFAAGATQVWFIGPGCNAPGCQTNAVSVGSAAYIAAQAILNTAGTYTVNIRNNTGPWVQVGTVNVVR